MLLEHSDLAFLSKFKLLVLTSRRFPEAGVGQECHQNGGVAVDG